MDELKKRHGLDHEEEETVLSSTQVDDTLPLHETDLTPNSRKKRQKKLTEHDHESSSSYGLHLKSITSDYSAASTFTHHQLQQLGHGGHNVASSPSKENDVNSSASATTALPAATTVPYYYQWNTIPSVTEMSSISNTAYRIPSLLPDTTHAVVGGVDPKSHDGTDPTHAALSTSAYPTMSLIPLTMDAEQYNSLISRFYENLRTMQRPQGDGSVVDQHVNGTGGGGGTTAAVVVPGLSGADIVKIPGLSTTGLATMFPYSNSRFILIEQPNVRQRKSYKNENRYILPNPLTICAREESPDEKLPKILDGTVSVRLVNAEGHDLPMNKQNILTSPDGPLVQNLDRSNAAHFALKILETSEGTMFRLLFVVNFTVEGLGTYEEKILSRPFQVYSNRKKNIKERPVVIDMKPLEGPISSETEVWIKGRGFSDRVSVTFGERVGRIVETTESMITVLSPTRFDIQQNSTVPVVVSNRNGQELLSAEKPLTFLYYIA